MTTEEMNEEITTEEITNEEVSTGDTGGGSASGGAATDESVSNDFQPTYNFKYAVEGDKQAEGEFDDLFKPLIKDEASYNKVKDLYEKAYGLDFIKNNRDHYREQFSEINDRYTTQTQALTELRTLRDNKDYRGLFEGMAIPEEDIIRYALERVQYKQATPEQRAAIDAQWSERSRIAQLELQNQQLQSNFENFSVQQRMNELDSVLQRPSVTDVARSFDERVGRPGAFRDEVIKRGQYYAQFHGTDPSAEQVVSEMLSFVGTPQVANAGQHATQNQAQGMGTDQRQKPVIPAIAGKGTSPVKKTYSSIEDLRKRSNELAMR